MSRWPTENHLRNVNPEQFYNIIKPEIAYFLGLFWGDGYLVHRVNKHEICLENKSEDGIEFYKNSLSKIGKWSVSNRNRGNSKMFKIGVNNEPLCHFLIDNKYDQKSKVSPNVILSKIPKDLIHLFWLGFLDADGCIYVCSTRSAQTVSFSGSYDQDWSALIKLFKELKIDFNLGRYKYKTKFGKIQRCSKVIVQNKKSIFSLCEYLYQSHDKDYLGLNRKYLKWKDIKSKYSD